MNQFHCNKHTKSGVTLVELLVVVTILMMLAAFAIPAVRPLTEGRRIREAVRAIDVFLAQAKTRAITVQRPVGVVFDRMIQRDLRDLDDPDDDTLTYQDDACNILRIVEIPPPYAGDLADSRVRIQNWSTLVNSGTPPPDRVAHPNPQYWNRIVLKLAVQSASFSDRILRRGDQVQFNFQGPIYTIVNDPADDDPSGDPGADFDVDADGYIVFGGSDGDSDGFIDDYILTVIAPASQFSGVSWPLTQSYRPSSPTHPTQPTSIQLQLGSSGRPTPPSSSTANPSPHRLLPSASPKTPSSTWAIPATLPMPPASMSSLTMSTLRQRHPMSQVSIVGP